MRCLYPTVFHVDEFQSQLIPQPLAAQQRNMAATAHMLGLVGVISIVY
jgi:hypothetical protein